jgi:E1A/CREB-binding protein
MSEIFIEAINPVMRQLGYCCGEKRQFTPLVQFCYGKMNCVIPRNQLYFVYERIIYCTTCFKALPAKGIDLAQNSATDPPKYSKIGKKNCQIH